MNIGKIILLLFTLLIGVLQVQDEQQKGVNEDDFPTLTMVTHLKVCIFIIGTQLNQYKTFSEINVHLHVVVGKCFKMFHIFTVLHF